MDEGLQLEGKNAVREAFAAGIPIQRLWFLKHDEKGALTGLKKQAADRGIPYKETDRASLDRMSKTGHHQGVIAMSAPVAFSEMEDIFARAGSEDPFLFLLDGIEDPHNFGAIIRTAEALGAHGIIVAKDRSAPLTEAVVRASAGAVHHIPIVRVTNLVRTMDELKKRPLWFVCADMDGEPVFRLSLTGPVCLVIGNEGHGVSRLVKEHCDFTASVPMSGKIASLNASVAAGILAAEIVRQRMSEAKK
ncbi:MAG: 23S rRNA (guanosine(2251)-2'-O)-methyltransferase RlmB [Lachnospiraceae bacterium]|nr:23S rRNA (guanosine(2251)-2'-O)-methyltransferase RlmB [Lachnospiraceae bacterium]